jgi:hypothetical protein
MEGVSGVQSVNPGLPPAPPANLGQIIGSGGPAAPAGSVHKMNDTATATGPQATAMTAHSAFSVHQSTTMLSISDGGRAAVVNDELLGALLLMLVLEYLRSDEADEKKGLLALAMMMAMSQSQGQRGTNLTYLSTSYSADSTQILMAGPASQAYTNAGASPASTADGSGGGVDVTV